MNFGFIVLTEIEKNKKYSRSNFSLVYILEFTQKYILEFTKKYILEFTQKIAVLQPFLMKVIIKNKGFVQ